MATIITTTNNANDATAQRRRNHDALVTTLKNSQPASVRREVSIALRAYRDAYLEGLKNPRKNASKIEKMRTAFESKLGGLDAASRDQMLSAVQTYNDSLHAQHYARNPVRFDKHLVNDIKIIKGFDQAAKAMVQAGNFSGAAEQWQKARSQMDAAIAKTEVLQRTARGRDVNKQTERLIFLTSRADIMTRNIAAAQNTPNVTQAKTNTQTSPQQKAQVKQAKVEKPRAEKAIIEKANVKVAKAKVEKPKTEKRANTHNRVLERAKAYDKSREKFQKHAEKRAGQYDVKANVWRDSAHDQKDPGKKLQALQRQLSNLGQAQNYLKEALMNANSRQRNAVKHGLGNIIGHESIQEKIAANKNLMAAVKNEIAAVKNTIKADNAPPKAQEKLQVKAAAPKVNAEQSKANIDKAQAMQKSAVQKIKITNENLLPGVADVSNVRDKLDILVAVKRDLTAARDDLVQAKTDLLANATRSNQKSVQADVAKIDKLLPDLNDKIEAVNGAVKSLEKNLSQQHEAKSEQKAPPQNERERRQTAAAQYRNVRPPPAIPTKAATVSVKAAAAEVKAQAKAGVENDAQVEQSTMRKR